MHEKRNQKDNRQWNADKPEKRAFYESHASLFPLTRA
jgi:hypothetical protein